MFSWVILKTVSDFLNHPIYEASVLWLLLLKCTPFLFQYYNPKIIQISIWELLVELVIFKCLCVYVQTTFCSTFIHKVILQQHWKHYINYSLFYKDHQAVWGNNNTLHLYLEGIWFKSGQVSSYPDVSYVFPQFLGLEIGCDCFLPNPYILNIHNNHLILLGTI